MAHTNVRTTSIENYHNPASIKLFNNQHKLIMNVFESSPNRNFTRKEIAKITGLETSTVSGRINELVHELYVLEELPEKRRCTISNINVFAVRLVELPVAQAELFAEAH